jgi:uncharacterized cupin superfamily protein
MPVIDTRSLPVNKGSDGIGYPAPLDKGCDLFESVSLGDAVGLTQFGVNIEKLLPAGMTSQRHWHENEDEFLYVLTGTVVLIEDDGEHELIEGSAAGWKAGQPTAHHLVNRTDEPAFLLIVGTRAGSDAVHFADVDLHYRRENGDGVYSHKDGAPYPEETADAGESP